MLGKIEEFIKKIIKNIINDKNILRKAGNYYENIKYYTSFFTKYPLEYCRYRYNLLTNKPYFGLIMQGGQTDIKRSMWMEKTVEQVSKKGNFINILEIGSWAGNSAIVWVNSINKFNQGKGMVTCIDPWKNYISLKDNKSSRFHYKQMESAFKNDNIIKLFFHNLKSSGNYDKVITMRGESKNVLTLLGNELFDIIYIDGSHMYKDVLSDIELSCKLLKNDGIICGDDLELQYEQVDKDILVNSKEIDYIIDPIQNRSYHPGVTLAVWEYFKKELSLYDGFWLIKKINNSWENINL